MADFLIKRNDVLPYIQSTLKTSTGLPLDLTSMTVRFLMKKRNATTLKVDGVGSIVGTATEGVVKYQWVTGDTDTAGTYLAEWELTLSGGQKQTVPNGGYIMVDVVEDLG